MKSNLKLSVSENFRQRSKNGKPSDMTGYVCRPPPPLPPVCRLFHEVSKSGVVKQDCKDHEKNYLAFIIARENEVLDQSARAIFDNHQCNFTNY